MSDPSWSFEPNAVPDPNFPPGPPDAGPFRPDDTGPFPAARDYGPLPPLEGGDQEPYLHPAFEDPAIDPSIDDPSIDDPSIDPMFGRAWYAQDHPGDGLEQPGRFGRHASAHKRGRPGWTVAPGWLAVAALVLFLAAVIGNLGMQRASEDGSGEEAQERPAQAAPAEPEAGQAAEPPPASRPPAQLTVLEDVNGEALGDVASYVDGTAAWVVETGHEDAGGGLAQVTVKVKLVNMGGEPVDVRTARVELTFADQSSRATRVARSELGTLKPNGGEVVGDWVFRMPANQLRDISVTLAPTDRHEPATFHGEAS